ncbi:ferredoxin domain-containing protein [Candidatus Methanoliparum sp. LAM-1]|uniref:ferredoxin domain-containing protein n=1 Tax=Candidatus Methanoliparum sp. LAM-1 TaxID=2874846 RepID=UPI001E344827|nr:DUF2148 domain-containing protein [Candidatus Methanoliparum sp. LAM-1]BDC35934.1 hypothetical protein MTLP_06160 [Candidatus Methanoliparum sp. LAM-1]
MIIKRLEEIEEETAIEIAKYMLASMITAPKTRGINDLNVSMVFGDDLKKLSDKMRSLSKNGDKNFIRDAKSVDDALVVILIGVKEAKYAGLDCGACGLDCNGLVDNRRKGKDFYGPICAFKLIDMGIAIGSAVKIASMFNIDNRIMYRVGVAALQLGQIEGDIALGIPLTIKGKNPFFDR